MPDARQGGRLAVEDDPLADEDEALDHVLDRAELVRDVQDRHAELAVQPPEQLRQRLLRRDVDAGRRLVERKQLRAGHERLRDERALLLPPGEPRQRTARKPGQPHALDRVLDGLAVGRAEPAERAQRRAASRDDLADRRRRLDAELRALGEIPEPSALLKRPAGSPNSRTVPRVGCSSPSASRRSVVLPPPFGPAIARNSPASTWRSTRWSTGGPCGYAKSTPASSSASGIRGRSAARAGSGASA